jgi:hypothetical protein
MTADVDQRDPTVRAGEAAVQAPVVVVGRDLRFLDVQPTVQQAEHHLALEHADGAVTLDSCVYFDGIARPLRPVLGPGGLTLEVAGAPEPVRLRERVNAVLAAAYEAYPPDGLDPDEHVDHEELEPLSEAYSFPRFLDELDRRFNARRRPVGPDHVGGRLHNFWHAIAG